MESNKTAVPIFTLLLTIFISLLLLGTCASCTTSVTIREGEIKTNSSNVIAEQTVKPDGEIQTKIDTTKQSWWDKMKIGINSAGKFIGNTVGNNTQYTVD